MRKPKSLSPSAFMQWEKDRDEYFLKYLADKKPPRALQPLPASVGSAFDAKVKSQLCHDLFGSDMKPEFEFDALFEDQVEPHNREEARIMGIDVYDNYVLTGAYDDLYRLMEDAQEAPQFEFDAGCVIDGVPINGKPDCRFVDKNGVHIILDWKVKGYCSKYGASPVKGYSLCRDGADWEDRNLTKRQLQKRADGGVVQGKHSQSHEKAHKLYLPFALKGLEINQGFLETCDKSWATQLSMYGWMMGEEVGDENVVVCIDEIACKYMGDIDGGSPLIRVAQHRARVSTAFQIDLFERLKTLWVAIQSGEVFPELTTEESNLKIELLNARASGMATDGTPLENWFSQLGRPTF